MQVFIEDELLNEDVAKEMAKMSPYDDLFKEFNILGIEDIKRI